jgi:HEAT repeat protein
MSLNDKKKSEREKRGQISIKDLEPYLNCSTHDLIDMLIHKKARIRTIAATILGNNKNEKAIGALCKALKNEKSLYSRIAISESLGKMGEAAVVPLTRLLGQIGNNQEKTLPKKYFNKKSYPLVRDMAARTLVKIGKPSTNYIIQVLEENPDIFIKQQAIDALGSLTAKTGNYDALKIIIVYFDDYVCNKKNSDKLTLWKLIRSLSAFKNSQKAANRLLMVFNCFSDPPLIWEAARSLGQIGVKSLEIIESLTKLEENENEEIKKAAKIALFSLEYNYNNEY